MDSCSYRENSPAHLSLIASMPRPQLRQRILPVLRGLGLGLLGGVALGMTLFACSPEGEPAEDPYALANAGVEVQAPVVPERSVPAAMGFDEAFKGRTSVSHYSASLTSDDPNTTTAALEALVSAHGGETTYSNGNASNGSVQAFVPFERFESFRAEARQLGHTFQSENRSTSDMRAELRRLADRRAALHRAHEALERSDSDMDAEAAAVLHELVLRERTSTAQQLDSYAQQLRGVQVNLSISR